MDTKSEITNCRVCESSDLQDILDLGDQCYTGRFLKEGEGDPKRARLAILRCQNCGLVQLKDSFPLNEMFGDMYGYRSSITDTMKNHLAQLSQYAINRSSKKQSLKVLDIGSNDATLLHCLDQPGFELTGIDPCANKHKQNYPDSCTVISDFFPSQSIDGKFDIITSIAMFYDIDDPVLFAKNICAVLDDEGIWITEQTHSHTLIESNCYDSICHEHVIYHSLSSMETICKRAGLKILEVVTNDMNGGSFRLLISKENSKHKTNKESIQKFRDKESSLKLNEHHVWKKFEQDVINHRNHLISFLKNAHDSGKKILGYGASTKGNVMLQYCGITKELLPGILERDPKKFGMVTPGTRIPIISEDEGREMKPDILIVFPWHFYKEIVLRESDFINRGGVLLFPLPEFKLVNSGI